MTDDRSSAAKKQPNRQRRTDRAQDDETDHQTTSDAAETAPAETDQPTSVTPFTQQIGRGAVAVVTILFGVFAAFNIQRVSFNWIFGETQVQTVNGQIQGGGVPLIILLSGAFVLGGIVGAALMWRRGRLRRVERAPRDSDTV